MRQIIIGNSDSSKLGTYKIVIGEETLSKMQSNPEQMCVLKKSKRFRSAFTTEQTNYLEKQFKKFQYINREQRQRVATVLKIGERPIKIWFQNRRMKEKKENHKDVDFETCGNAQKSGKDQLSNVSLPTANDGRLYSLPMLSLTADTTTYANTDSMKANIVNSEKKVTTKPESPNSTTPSIEKHVKANFYKEVQNQESLAYFNQQPIVDTTVQPTTNEKNKKSLSQEYKSNTSAEFSINLCKKYKQQSGDAAMSGNIVNEDQKMKSEPKPAQNHTTNHFNHPKDLPASKKCKISYPPLPKLPTHMSMNNPMFYPAMPSVYPPPVTSMPSPYVVPDGVLWKPVNFMLTTNSPPMNIGHQTPLAHTVHEQSKTCICNCHGSSQPIPVGFPPSIPNPFAQYLITVPFPHTSPNF